jgi:hypothetical protein
VPRVIRPDILLTENGFRITELDSVPGGIGLTGVVESNLFRSQLQNHSLSTCSAARTE